MSTKNHAGPPAIEKIRRAIAKNEQEEGGHIGIAGEFTDPTVAFGIGEREDAKKCRETCF